MRSINLNFATPLSWPVEKFQAIIAAGLSIMVVSAIVYEMAYFNALLISIRAVPLTITDYSSEIVRLVPLYFVVGAIGWVMHVILNSPLRAISIMLRIHQRIRQLNASLVGAPHYEQSRVSRNVHRFWERTDKVRKKIDRARIALICIGTGLSGVVGVCGVFGPAISSETADPVYSIYSHLGAGGAMIGVSFWFLSVVKKNRISGFFLLIISCCWLISAWASYVAISNYDKGQAAMLLTGTTQSNVRIVGSFEKGLLIRNTDALRFVFWDEIEEVTYLPASKADILEPWLQSVKVPYDNPLKSNANKDTPPPPKMAVPLPINGAEKQK